MGLNIEDGKGRGYNVSVSEANRLNVASKSNPRIFYVSRDESQAFMLTSNSASSAAGDIMFYLKNTSTTKNIFIKQVHVYAVNAALWKVWTVTGTASGTTLTPTNLNLGSGLTADAIGVGDGDVTGLTLGNRLGVERHAANGEGHLQYEDALILGPNDAIAVEYDTGTTGAADVHMSFHFEDIERNN